MKKIIILLSFTILFYGCDMIEYHPYDGRISGERDINAKNIKRIEETCAEKTTIRFILVSDTQRWYDETVDFVNNTNSRTDIDFVLHAGDFTDFGLTKEFMWQRDILNKLNIPYVALIGNHDCLANGEEIFRKIFGEVNFSFIAGKTKFVCLNTNALEYDYSRPVPDFNFIEDELNADQGNYEKTVFAMHARPYSEQFNNNVAKPFQHYVNQFPKVQFCLNGHDHNLNINDVFDDGIIYYGVPNVAKRKYFIFTITSDDKYEYEVVEF